MDYKVAASQLKEALRLRTDPFGVTFLKDAAALPEKTRRPSQVFRKRVTICQGITMTRIYGWALGLTKEDLICPPGMLAFGFAPTTNAIQDLGQLFYEGGYHRELEPAVKEMETLPRFEPEEVSAIYLAPLEKLALEPEVVVVYGNPAQLNRLIQAAIFQLGARVSGDFGGKVECAHYLIGPYQSGELRVTIPGQGDRVFSMTQDDEMVLSFPAKVLEGLLVGLKEAGRKLGARYPITVYQNFTPALPPHYKACVEKWGLI